MKRRTLAVVVASVLMVGLVLRQRGVEAPPEASPEQTAGRDEPAPSPDAASPSAPKDRVAIPRPRPKARRAPSAAPSPTVVGAQEAEPEPEQAPDSGQERGGVDPSIPLTPEGLMSVADKMRPSIAECIDAWTSQVPEINGKVVLAFQLNAEGVQDAWVTQHEEVPVQVLGCFSAAVYEQDWPAAPEGVEVTLPFTIEAGLAPEEPGGQLQDKR